MRIGRITFMRKKKYNLPELPQNLNKKIGFKILYDGRYPSEKAAALFVSEQAHHLLKNGYEVEIITSTRKISQENQKYTDKTLIYASSFILLIVSVSLFFIGYYHKNIPSKK